MTGAQALLITGAILFGAFAITGLGGMFAHDARRHAARGRLYVTAWVLFALAVLALIAGVWWTAVAS